ncbi:MAG TPA: 7-cyano-7-deazaguanine synthase QueC [Leptospiraceae bacterium]|nr:7-cyano-7-deazaguanine synthase QueC [Spirochaetaceae bacterium]HBS06564.1 7-cyano-7-deazaguanine synthase QueC [Leptospiraceae bacterium]
MVLLSGGLDSATTLYYALSRDLSVYTLSFDYGQRHSVELESARKIAAEAGVPHTILTLDTQIFQQSALTDVSIDIPQDRDESAMSSSIPVTYVPGRNILFLSFGLSYCESRNLDSIFIGANAVDYSGYPDCRPQFIEAFQQMANIGTRAGDEGHPIKIEAPLINMTKAEIISMGIKLGVDYSLTSSCYQPSSSGKPCGRCDSCLLRAQGFAAAGVPDPLTA